MKKIFNPLTPPFDAISNLASDITDFDTEVSNNTDVAANTAARHTRSHVITSTSDHTSTATPGQILKADANGLPIDATNTDAQVAAAVTASHAAVTVSDTSTVDLTLTGQALSAAVIPAGLNLQDLGGAVTDAQVPNTITLDNITQITTRSHTSLSDIGTNTHTQIDTHIANTSNPHSVTKTQVGLANVSNDAQLKIASNLSDVASASTSRTNLGLGTAAVVNTGTSSGNVPVLDGSGKLSTGVLPALAITDTFVVASQVAMLALTAETGDIAIRSDESKSYILQGTDPTSLADWEELLSPGGGVTSVFGRTGAVTAQTNDYTWAQVNKTTSDIADIATKSHTSLTSIGTNTHAQIDTHIASTSNPHSVTKTQVGLSNVTDDAQLKRAAADFTSFTAKSTPVAADTFLIEDSAASDAKKKTTVAQVNAVLDHNTLAGKEGGLSGGFYHIGGTMYNNIHSAAASTFLVRGEGSSGAMNDREVAAGGGIDFTSSAEPKISSVFAPIFNYRLSLTTGVPVTTSDVTAATTLYITPYKGNTIGLQTNTGAYWLYLQPNEVSLATSAFNFGSGSAADTNYDIYVQQNGTSVTPHAIPWTNATTRSVSFTMVNGLHTFGATYSYGRYVGTVRTTSGNQLEDSEAKRLVYNYNNRVQRKLKVIESTDTWTYNTATWRQANASSANQVGVVQGVAEDTIYLRVDASASSDTSGRANVGIGLDRTTGNDADTMAFGNNTFTTSALVVQSNATYNKVSSAGYHYYAWNEIGIGSGNLTWRGDNGNNTIMQSGMLGMCWS